MRSPKPIRAEEAGHQVAPQGQALPSGQFLYLFQSTRAFFFFFFLICLSSLLKDHPAQRHQGLSVPLPEVQMGAGVEWRERLGLSLLALPLASRI